MKPISPNLLCGILSLFYTAAFSQQIFEGDKADKIVADASMVRLNDARGSVDFIRLSAPISVEDKVEWLEKALRVSSDVYFLQKKSTVDKSKENHYEYAQFYKGLPVEYGVYKIHTKDGKINSANGEYYAKINLSTNPSLTEEAAVQKLTIDGIESSNIADCILSTTLLVFPYKGQTYLAYKFDVFEKKRNLHYLVYIDANTGDNIFVENRVCNIDTPCIANTMYSGSRQIIANMDTPSYRLYESGRGGGIHTTRAGGDEFFNASTTWAPTVLQERAALDAHWGMEQTYDYFSNIHSRNSFDGTGGTIYLNIDDFEGQINASWNGFQSNFGLGDGFTAGPLTSIDVVGHEFTHGLTQYTANLVYADESGALNESFSDIFGVAIDYYARPSNANFLLGEEFHFNGSPFRNMSAPNQTGHPDTYLGNFWQPGAGASVHNNSAIGNHWFYLLSMGGSGTNDNNDSYFVAPIGIQKAEQIAYKSLSVYLTPNSTYADGRFYSIQAALDLYGPCSPEVISATNAWYAVGVGDVFNDAVVANFTSTSQHFCNTPANILFTNNSMNGSSYQWNFGDNSPISSLQNPMHTYTSPGVYTVSLIAMGGGQCSNSSTFTQTAYITVTNGGGPIASDCAPVSSSNCSGLGISGVTLNTINSTSNDCSEGYRDFSCSHRTNLVAGNYYPITLALSSFIPQNVMAWIDANNDGSFSTTERVLFATGIMGVWEGYIYTDVNSNLNTPLRMRVMSTDVSEIITGPCYNPRLGQAEDYQVTFSANTLAPEANFIAYNREGSTGLAVQFFDLSSNAPTSWEWSFPGSNTPVSTSRNPIVTYQTPGVYQVTLRVSNSFGQDTEVKTSYITIFEPSLMCHNLTSTSTAGTLFDSGGPNGYYGPNEFCSFVISPPCADSFLITIVNASMDWNDYLSIYEGSNRNTSPLVLHLFGNILGSYSFIARSNQVLIEFASWNGGYPGYEIRWQAFTDTAQISASFNVSDSNPALNENVDFTSQSTSNILSWSWNFGDGTTSPLENPSHSYSTPGTYLVSHTVANCRGEVRTFTQEVRVQAAPIINVNPMVIDLTGHCGEILIAPLTIRNTGRGDLLYVISGGMSQSILPGRIVNTNIPITTTGLFPGNHTHSINISSNDPTSPLVVVVVNLNVTERALLRTYDGCIDIGATLPSLTLTGAFPIENLGCEPLTYSTTLLGGNGFSIASGHTGTVSEYSTNSIPISFNNQNYGVYLQDMVITSNGGTDTVCLRATVTEETRICSTSTTIDSHGLLTDPGGVNDNYANSTYCGFLIAPPCPDFISLSFSQFSLESGYDYIKVYDGSTGWSPQIGHFTGHNIPQTVTALSGQMFIEFYTDGSVTYPGFVASWSSQSPRADARFEAIPSRILTGQNVTFSKQIDPIGTSYFWEFGNGTTSTEFTPTTTYSNPGQYQVTLTTTVCGVSSSSMSQVEVYELESGLNFSAFPNPFVGNVSLSYSLSSSKSVTLTIYDALGQKVIDLLSNQIQSSGLYQFDYSPGAAGVYFAVLKGDSESQTIKVVKLGD